MSASTFRFYISPGDHLPPGFAKDPLGLEKAHDCLGVIVFKRTPNCPYVLVEARVVEVESRYSHERNTRADRLGRFVRQLKAAWRTFRQPA